MVLRGFARCAFLDRNPVLVMAMVMALILGFVAIGSFSGVASGLAQTAPPATPFESPFLRGYVQSLTGDQPVTVTFEFTLGDVESLIDADGRLYLAGFSSSDDGLPDVALTAVGEKGWFASSWQLRFEVSPGLLEGDPKPIVLRRGLTQHFLSSGHLYQSTVSYEPDSREISMRLVDLTQGEEIFSGFAFLSVTSGAPDFVEAVLGVSGVDPPLDQVISLESVRLTSDYRRFGAALPLTDIRAIAVKNGEDRSAGSLYWSDDSLGFVITRSFGRLPGSYVFVVEPESQDEHVLTTVSAEDLRVAVDLGKQVLPPGSHHVRVMYIQAASDVTDAGYETVVRDMTIDVIPPQVQAHVDLPLLDLVKPDLDHSVSGTIAIEANQTIDQVSVRLETAAGKRVLETTLEDPSAGLTSIPFTLHGWRADHLTSPLKITLQLPGSAPVERLWTPVTVGLSIGRGFEEIQSYSQAVRRLTRTEATSQDTVFTHDLLEVRVSSDIVDQHLTDELQVVVSFVSPSGKTQTVSARRLESPDKKENWVARLLPEQAGAWTYRVELKHPEAIPHGQVIDQMTLMVRQGEQSVPTVRRPWGPSVPKPEGQRVSSIRYRRGSTVKLEQLIGDWDNERQIPTLNQTLSDYGYIGTDLGQSFEHDGKLIILFGDTMGTRGFIESTLAHSVSENPEEGLRLDIYTDRRGNTLAIKPPGLTMGGFEVPSGGMSIDGEMYFIVKDQTTVTGGGRTFRSVLVRYDETDRTFIPLREFSPFRGKFHEVIAHVAPENTPGLPGEGPWMLFWGSGEYYRESPLYLAVTRVSDIEKDNRTYYFAGTNGDGAPIWGHSESDAVPVVNHRQIGEFSVIWSEELQVWLLTYNSGSPRGFIFRWADQPWGTWSPAQIIFEPWQDGGYARFMHALNMPNPDLAGPVINPEPPAVQQWGGEYAPYMIERFTRFHDHTLTIYYLMSTWNPYVVVLMRTDLDVILTDD